MATPTRIMVIRHGEKPIAKQTAPFGIDADGNQHWHSLTVPGWQRAGALLTLFAPTEGGLPDLAVPAVIYATGFKGESSDGNESGDANGSSSKRPVETITPLAARLGITPNANYNKGEEKKLAEAVMQQSGAVLICWQHEAINDIARHLVKSAGTTVPIPPVWPDTRFDIVWVFTPPASLADPWGFVQVPQCLLAGDSDTVIE